MTSSRPRIALVVATSDNNIIGRDGDMPWHLPADLRRFKSLTMGHPIVMGRRTWESIGRPLPGRRNIVLTRSEGYPANGADVLHSPDDVMAATKCSACIMVIGGGEVYRLFLDQADVVHRTRVHTMVDGDTSFPQLDGSLWELASEELHDADESHAHAMTFETWTRR